MKESPASTELDYESIHVPDMGRPIEILKQRATYHMRVYEVAFHTDAPSASS